MNPVVHTVHISGCFDDPSQMLAQILEAALQELSNSTGIPSRLFYVNVEGGLRISDLPLSGDISPARNSYEGEVSFAQAEFPIVASGWLGEISAVVYSDNGTPNGLFEQELNARLFFSLPG